MQTALTGVLSDQDDYYTTGFRRLPIQACPAYPSSPDENGKVWPTMLDSTLNMNYLAQNAKDHDKKDVGFHPVGLVPCAPSSEEVSNDKPQNYHAEDTKTCTSLYGTYLGWKAKVIKDYINKRDTEFVFDKYGNLFARDLGNLNFSQVEVEIEKKKIKKNVLLMWGTDIYGQDPSKDASWGDYSMQGYATMKQDCKEDWFGEAYASFQSTMDTSKFVQVVSIPCNGTVPPLGGGDGCGVLFANGINTGQYILPSSTSQRWKLTSVQGRAQTQNQAWPQPSLTDGKSMNPILSEDLTFILYREDALHDTQRDRYYFRRNNDPTQFDYLPPLSGDNGVYKDTDIVNYRYYIFVNPIHGTAFDKLYTESLQNNLYKTTKFTSMPNNIQQLIQNYCQALAPPGDDMNCGLVEEGESGYNPDPTCACLMQAVQPLLKPIGMMDYQNDEHGAGGIFFSGNSYPNLVLADQVIEGTAPLNQYRYFTNLGGVEWDPSMVSGIMSQSNHASQLCKSSVCWYQNSQKITDASKNKSNVWPPTSFVKTWSNNNTDSTGLKMALCNSPQQINNCGLNLSSAAGLSTGDIIMQCGSNNSTNQRGSYFDSKADELGGDGQGTIDPRTNKPIKPVKPKDNRLWACVNNTCKQMPEGEGGAYVTKGACEILGNCQWNSIGQKYFASSDNTCIPVSQLSVSDSHGMDTSILGTYADADDCRLKTGFPTADGIATGYKCPGITEIKNIPCFHTPINVNSPDADKYGTSMSACKDACAEDGSSGVSSSKAGFPWVALIMCIVGCGIMAIMIYFIVKTLITNKKKKV